MKFACVKELKHKTMDLLKQVQKADIIITAYGKPLAVLHGITEEDLEDYIIEHDPAFRKKLEASLKEYLQSGGVSADELISKLEKRLESEKV